MRVRFTFHPVLYRFLAASIVCLGLNTAALEWLVRMNVQVHLAEGIALCLATAMLALAGRFFFLDNGKGLTTAKGQPVPFGALAVAGAVLNFMIFTRVLALLPTPVSFLGHFSAVAAGCAAAAISNFALIYSLLPQADLTPRKPLLKAHTVALVLIWAFFILLALGSMQLSTQLQGIYAWPEIKFPLGPDNGPDTWLRLTQVRDWISGGGFFDHTVRNTNAPFGGISTHWTRPMDALVAGLYYLMPEQSGVTPLVAMDKRLMLAAAWLPAILCLLSVALLGSAAGRHFKHTQAMGCIAILLLISVFRYTSPGDVDHHGLLAVLWCGALSLLLVNAPRMGTSLLLGALLGIMIWVSQESLLIVGAVFALMGAEALLLPQKARALFLAATGAAIIATAGLFVEIPADEIIARPMYDTLSVVQACLLWLTVAGTGLMALAFARLPSFGARMGVAAVLAGAIFGAQFLLYPKFFSGPLVDADPFIFTGFLPRIVEAQTLFATKPGLILRIMMPPALAAFLLGIALRKQEIRPGKKRFLAVLAVLLGVTFILTLSQVRWGYYMQAVSMVVVGGLLPGMAVAARDETGKWLKDVPRYARAYLVLGCLYLALSLMIRDPHTPTARSLCNMQAHYVMQSQQLQKLLGDKNLILYVYQDFGGETQFFTPYRIIASNYHREGSGLHAIYDIEKAETTQEARPLLAKRDVGAMMVCTENYEDKSWLHGLTPEKLPPWLQAVEGMSLLKIPGDKPLLLRITE